MWIRSSPDFDGYFKINSKSRSVHGEDKVIYNTFFKNADITNGTYVELGAFDGKQASSTSFFYICLGWKGLLIEGNPTNYQARIGNRPFAHKMSFAPTCDAAYKATNKTIEFIRCPTSVRHRLFHHTPINLR